MRPCASMSGKGSLRRQRGGPPGIVSIQETVLRIGFIRRAKALGFSLREIRVLLALRVDPTMRSGEVKASGTGEDHHY